MQSQNGHTSPSGRRPRDDDPYAVTGRQLDAGPDEEFERDGQAVAIGLWTLGAGGAALLVMVTIGIVGPEFVGLAILWPSIVACAGLLSALLNRKRLLSAAKRPGAFGLGDVIVSMSLVTHAAHACIVCGLYLLLGLFDSSVLSIAPVIGFATLIGSVLLGGLPNLIFGLWYHRYLKRRFAR